MSRQYYSKRKLNKKDKFFALNRFSNILIQRCVLEDGFPALKIQSFVPKSFLSKSARKKGKHELIRTKKIITIPLYHACDLAKVLNKILPDQAILDKPDSYFGENFVYPKNSIITFPDDTVEETTKNDSSDDSSN